MIRLLIGFAAGLIAAYLLGLRSLADTTDDTWTGP